MYKKMPYSKFLNTFIVMGVLISNVLTNTVKEILQYEVFE